MRFILICALALWAAAAGAQPAPSNLNGGYWAGAGCNVITFGSPNGPRTMMVDANGNLCITGTVSSVPFQQTGAGSLSVSASTAVNGMTQTYGASLPTKWTNLIVIDNGTGDVAVCPQGGTCTCAETSVAATNGTTIKAGGGSNQFNWPNIAAATPTIVSCGGSAQPVDFEF